MLRETFQSIRLAARNVFKNWRSMLLIAIAYAALLALLYFFVIIREATFVQVSLTFASAIVAPLIFFLLQAMIASDAEQVTTGGLIRKSLTSFWKLLLITLPLIAIAILIAYLIGKAQTRFGATLPTTELARPRSPLGQKPPRPIDWRAALLSTIRYLAFGLALPLAAIHLWLATAREGLGMALKRIGTHLARAFSPRSVLIYIAGFLIFGVVPYFLLFRSITTKHAWLELFLLVARLAVIFALTLFGWMITVRALSLFPAGAPKDQSEAA